MYVPPPWPLWHLSDPEGQTGTRWLPSWQGPATAEAEEVCLGWVGQGSQAVVSTAREGRHPTVLERRQNALLLVLGGNQLVLGKAQRRGEDTQALLGSLPSDDTSWSVLPVSVDDGTVMAEVCSYSSDVFIGYARVGEMLASFATVGLDASTVCLCTVTEQSASTYSLNPLAFATTAKADRQHRPLTSY